MEALPDGGGLFDATSVCSGSSSGGSGSGSDKEVDLFSLDSWDGADSTYAGPQELDYVAGVEAEQRAEAQADGRGHSPGAATAAPPAATCRA